jgi:hypothetical protein
MYIHMYTSPTAGGTDGVQVSEGTGAAPVTTAFLNASANEVGTPIKLALRCDAGYQTNGNTTITPTGTFAAKWNLAPDNAGSAGAFGADGAVLTITSTIGATNVIFWARAKATNDENPINDSSVDLVVSAMIQATS